MRGFVRTLLATAAIVIQVGTLQWEGTAAAAGAASTATSAPQSAVTQTWLTNPESLPVMLRGSPTLAAQFFDRPGSEEWDGSIPEGWTTTPYVNYGSYARFMSDLGAGTAPDVGVLMYDPENWWRTPLDEKQRPRYYMQQFGQAARANGYVVINAPGMSLLDVDGGECVRRTGEDAWTAYIRCQFPFYAASDADGYDIQAQQWECNPSLWPSRHPPARVPTLVDVYATRVGQAAAQARSANPDIAVYSGLSTGWCAPTGDDLYAAWNAARPTVAGHFIHAGPDKARTITNFFARVAPVTVSDDAFAPTDLAVIQDVTVTWQIGWGVSRTHSVVDASGMGLFGSGLLSGGSTYRHTFHGAGTYTVKDGATGHTGTVSIRVQLSAATGGTGTHFTIQAATGPAPVGCVYETQIQRPGSIDFVYWKSGPTNTFTPDSGPGDYSFRAHLKRKSSGASSGWSVPAAITVS